MRVLRTCGELDAIVTAAGPEAVRLLASGEDGEVPRVAEAPGMTEEAARVRLARTPRSARTGVPLHTALVQSGRPVRSG
ncbi:hypothetical protein [Streptomyces sp. NPDC094049]|uniref:hypothetical protein n=1 Tax=Streptomyces sp. NPDC094049 TaxID=3154987 RepID=UPI0033281B94